MIETNFVDTRDHAGATAAVDYARMDEKTSADSTFKTIVAHVCALGVAGVFMFAAHSKIFDPRQFAMDIRNYHILPVPLTNPLAIFLPWIELGAAAMILIPQCIGLWGWLTRDPQVKTAAAILLPRMVRAGSVVIVGMLSVFICAISYATLMGYDIGCGCFGHSSGKAGLKTLLFDAALLAMTIAAYLWVPGSRTLRHLR